MVIREYIVGTDSKDAPFLYRMVVWLVVGGRVGLGSLAVGWLVGGDEEHRLLSNGNHLYLSNVFLSAFKG